MADSPYKSKRDSANPEATTKKDSGGNELEDFINRAGEDVAAPGRDISNAVNTGLSDLVGHIGGGHLFGLLGGPSPEDSGGGGSAPAAKKGGPTLSGEEAEVKKLQGELKSETNKKTEEDQYQQLADTQAKQYLDMTKSLDPLTSGANLPALEGTAAQNASQMLGASATSPVSQWLNQQTQAAQAQNAPAAAANAQVGVAQDYASTLLAGGLENMGQAEAKMMQAAPYQQLLSSLAADVPYKLLGGTPFSSLLPEVSSAVTQIPGLSTTAIPTSAAASAPQVNAGIVPPAPTPPVGAPGVLG